MLVIFQTPLFLYLFGCLRSVGWLVCISEIAFDILITLKLTEFVQIVVSGFDCSIVAHFFH